MDNEIGGEGTVGSLITQTVNEMLNGKYNQKTLCTILTAILLIMSVNVVGASGTDPLDPSDGGADWDGDGLTNAKNKMKEQISIIPIRTAMAYPMDGKCGMD